MNMDNDCTEEYDCHHRCMQYARWYVQAARACLDDPTGESNGRANRVLLGLRDLLVRELGPVG